ncbi:MAG: OPT/YSL family transporter, partial [Thermoplasmata archaeon]|nr:OPT/YSL family transporter [Thermoplasmata archaeon]
MGEVRKSSYRMPPTPKGIKGIEEGTVDYFQMDIWDNLNTGLLEEYLDEKNRRESFERSKFDWFKVGIGIVIGTAFALITQYVGLKVGIAISGSWYVVYLIGIAGKWRPSELNIATGASTGATYISTGFIFTFPAMYLLSNEEVTGDYAIGVDSSGELIYLINDFPPMFVALVATIIAGFLGVLYFIIFRRIWLVDDPLHVPGIEAHLQLLEMSNNITTGAAEKAHHAIKLILASSVVTGILTVLKDLPFDSGLIGDKRWDWNPDKGRMVIREEPILDQIFGKENEMGEWYNEAVIQQPLDSAKFTWMNFGIIPIEVGIGWFMKFRVALLISLGTLITWFLIIPMAVYFDVPIYDPRLADPYPITDNVIPAVIGYKRVARFIAIGAILGGGITALIKNAPIFKTIFGDLNKAIKGKESEAGSYIEGKGWYEWPLSHIFFMAIFAFFSIGFVFSVEYDIVPSFILAGVLALTTFFLGAIAVKVMGETGTEPVSGTSFIVLLLLIILFKYILNMPNEETAIMSIIG